MPKIKLRPGYKFGRDGVVVATDKRVRSKKELMAIAASYATARREGRAKAALNPYPKARMVCDMTVKLTPRRRELLLAVMHGLLEWRLEPEWGHGYPRNWHSVPYYGNVNVASILTTMRRMRLVKLLFGPDIVYRGARIDDYRITVRGVSAAMEACDYENTREKHALSIGAG